MIPKTNTSKPKITKNVTERSPSRGLFSMEYIMTEVIETDTYGVAAGELRQFIEQYEQLDTERLDVVAGQKELLAEAKARGYDTKVMRKIIALRKRDKDEVAEEDAIFEMYSSALGM